MAAPRYSKISVARESHYVCNVRTCQGELRVGRSNFFVQFLSQTQDLCDNFPSRRIEAAPRVAAAGEEKEGMTLDSFLAQPETRVQRTGNFFIWIRRKALKSPESAKGIQGNPSFFSWIYLVFLGFICTVLARWLQPGLVRTLRLSPTRPGRRRRVK